MKKSLLFFTCILLPLFSFSEDIELYIGNTSQREDTKPQVLLIVDTSGSMADTQSIKTPYDSTKTYKTLGGFSGSNKDYLYYAVGTGASTPVVDSPEETRRFLNSINNCSAAVSRLNKVGFYTGRIREYTFEGNTGSWQEVPESDGSEITIIDCEDDINLDLTNIKNGLAVEHDENEVSIGLLGLTTTVKGYPIDGAGNAVLPEYYDSDIEKVESSWGGDVVTVYTDNYLRWDQGTKYSNNKNIGETIASRISIAQRTLSDLVESIPSVQFGLQVYNINSKEDKNSNVGHGGRIAFGIQDITANAKADLQYIIDNDLHAAGSTPLCESYYEAYRYFSGSSVYFGDTDFSSYLNSKTQYHNSKKPDRDTSIESKGTYIAPYKTCSNEIFVILITDGIPQNDSKADNLIKSLHTSVGSTAQAVDGNYLPALAKYMHSNDINAQIDGTQIATLYTVGFSEGAEAAEDVLIAAATNGGGQYYDANDPTKLGSSLQKALSAILEVTTSFTAPSVATNSFDRTESQDSAYYGMFIPESGAKWKGNLKKLKLVNDEQVGRDDEVAIDSDGNMLASAKTYWKSTSASDGNNVEAGGVVGMFNNKEDARDIYSDIGEGNSLNPLNYTSMVDYYGGTLNTLLAFGVLNILEADKYINWALGFDVDDADNDNDTGDYRPDLFGDPLHSKPVAINYGGSDEDNPDIRIVVGTNSGVLHMFRDKGETVEESWAFMPKRFFSDIKSLRDNLPAANKVYGVDGPITAFTIDSNGDGTISGTDEKAWIFFGLRRGGNSYYALNVTDPGTPEYMWEITADTPGFAELGQTWSQPVVGYSKLNIVGGSPKPVLIFGAGYSIAKDASGPGTEDEVGRGIYMVDAASGDLLWSITPGPTSKENTQFTGLTGFTDSIPSKIAVFDSDSDGLIDRLYTGDTGGNVFRIDMPGSDPFDSDTPWTAFKFAKLGGITNADDRRFFSEATVEKTFFTDTVKVTIDGDTTVVSQETPYDVVLIGSGDRSTPTSTDTDDKFFMLQDENVVTQSFVAGAVAPSLEPPSPILFSDAYLHDFTDNPYDSLTGTDKQNLDEIVSKKSGWYYNYGLGERSTGGAILVKGKVLFPAFVPGTAADPSSCSLSTGQGFIYTIDLFDGTNAYDTRRTVVTSTMPDTPTIVIPPSGTVTTTPDENDPPGTDSSNILILTGGVPISTDVSLSTFSTYQYVTEQ
ncbi:pilus assembly protein [Pseudocolwellia sp. HL-MZ19]|uniref:pilus assembly protein n=1 Tax=Pseudocolwellia sp. HL-MZ19 TaxID=3400846 RepID=UPI003CF1FFEB